MTTLPADPPIEYEIDPDVEPGDVVGALAALLIEVVEGEDAGGGGMNTEI